MTKRAEDVQNQVLDIGEMQARIPQLKARNLGAFASTSAFESARLSGECELSS
jgi:hypothetical protein